MSSLGYIASAEHLAQEAGIGTDRFELCDNMNFFRVLVDFENAFTQKYGYKPKIAKPIPKTKRNGIKVTNPYELPPSLMNASTPTANPDGRPYTQKSTKKAVSKPDGNPNHPPRSKTPLKDEGKGNDKGKSKNEKKIINPGEPHDLSFDGFSLNATPITPQQVLQPKNDKNKEKSSEGITDDTPLPIPPDVQLMKPIPPQLRADFGDLTNVIARDIFSSSTGVTWDDIVGLTDAKRVLREAIVMPLKFPHIFEGKKLLRPWKGVLLHGPPGTGKTLLAKAVAGEGTTFFNVSASTVVSKFRGDSEKLIRVLFELARYHAPSTIFIDEMDAIMSKRSTQDEHEASRRMKTEMLTQMDGLVQSDALVFVLAASNFPFDLDPALLRRLEKRILVPLPDGEARVDMFSKLLTSDIANSDIDFEDLSKKTEGYSGSDIRLVCKEAAMEPLRRLMGELQEKYGPDYLDIASAEDAVLGPVTEEDVETALSRTKPSAMYSMKKYEEWQEKYGVT